MTKSEKAAKIAKIRKQKYATLDDALLAGTGMDREERQKHRETVDDLFKIRNNSKKGSKAWRDASNKIARMHGWPEKY
jgi:hypothetical protein